MNCKVLISPLFILMWATAPSTLAVAAIPRVLTARTAKTQIVLKNTIAQNICVDKNGNKYHCP